MIPLLDENPTRRVPYVSYTLILLCVGVFIWQLSLGPQAGQFAVYAFGLVPSALFGHTQLPPAIAVLPPAATIFTSMFLHGGISHIFGNMLYLWIFADNVEDSMGHVRFLVFYLLCGVAAAMAQALPAPDSTVPMIGASGAISGVLGAYLLLYPRTKIVVFVPFMFFMPLIKVPSVMVLGLWFIVQLIESALAPEAGGGIAFRAHIGGFIAGMLLIGLFKKRRIRLFK